MYLNAMFSYFQGERQEMFAGLAGSLLIVLLASALFVLNRDAFSKTLLVTAVIVAVLLSSTALSLLHRDTRLRTELTRAFQSDQAERALAGERTRIEEVISKYAYYRYAAAAIGLLALAALVFSRKGWAHGLAAGLLLLVVAQVVIDFYSEQRARHYHEQLVRDVSTDIAPHERADDR